MITWAYIAGFFDGEGTIGGCGTSRGQRGNSRVFCRIYQQDMGVLEKISGFLAGHGIGSTMVSPHRHGFAGNPQYGLNIPIRHIPRFLAGIRPYVLVKKQKVEDVARYLAFYPALTSKQVAWLGRESRWSKSVVLPPEPWRPE